MSDYTEKLKDPRWQRLRLEIFQRDNFACRFCYTDSETLHCHHLKYITGREPWDYPLDHLITLCAFCHDQETKRRKESIAKLIEVVTIKTPIPARAVREIAYFLEESLQNELPDVAVRAIEWALLPGDDDQSLVSRFTSSPRWLENRV